MRWKLTLLLSICVIALGAEPSATHRDVIRLVEAHAAEYKATSRKIWEFAEVGYQEQKSSALLQQQLKAAGFSIQAGVGGMPTAFVASYGSGKPVVGILGEFDALPGLSQETVPERRPVVANSPGHACGHNLLGSGGALAAVAVKEYMASNKLPGTLRFYGAPAEEGGSGKIYLIRAGLFKDVDAVVHWHPGDHNSVENGSGVLAMMSAKFEFRGSPAHAAAAPDRGRSALDGLMLMANAVEFLREHVPASARMHYIITKGGAAPNIVPDDTELFLYARHPSMTVLSGIWDRILKCAQGAAMATETTVKSRIVNSDYNILPNTPLAEQIHRTFVEIGGVTYSPTEQEFANSMVRAIPAGPSAKLGSERIVQPLDMPDSFGGASTDVGDVSWVVPTIGITAATWVPGTPAHSWQAVASSGMAIGQDGMVLAAKVLAATAQDLLTNERLRQQARSDFEKQLGGAKYESKIPADQGPPLDYRKTSGVN